MRHSIVATILIATSSLIQSNRAVRIYNIIQSKKLICFYLSTFLAVRDRRCNIKYSCRLLISSVMDGIGKRNFYLKKKYFPRYKYHRFDIVYKAQECHRKTKIYTSSEFEIIFCRCGIVCGFAEI